MAATNSPGGPLRGGTIYSMTEHNKMNYLLACISSINLHAGGELEVVGMAPDE